MNIINQDYEKFINQTDIRITQQILRWGLVHPDDQRLIRIAFQRTGGTFSYIDAIYHWINRELRQFPALEDSIRDHLRSLNEEDEETAILPQSIENASIDVIGGLHDLSRSLRQTKDKLKFILRKRLAETAEFLNSQESTTTLRPIQERLRYVETTDKPGLRIIKHWLSDCGDQVLDEFIEDMILIPIRDIVVDINYNIPDYRLERLDLIDFPAKPLTISQLNHYPGGFSWFDIRDLQTSPSEPDEDSPVRDPSDNLNFNPDENRNPDVDDYDWSD